MSIFHPRRGILFLLRFYQKVFSPDHGLVSFYFPYGFCRFYPSCSEYGYQSITHRGFLRGGFRALYRILRCNPFSEGGIDLPS